MKNLLAQYNFWTGTVKGVGLPRKMYQKRLSRLNSGKTIVTITGLRRVGKSYITRQFIDYLIHDKHVAPCQILYINLFIRELNALKDPNEFQKAIKIWQKDQNVDTNKRMYILIDEVQEIEQWQKLVNSLYEDYTQEYKLIITGSNSKLLSGELGTYLAGRSHELTVYPLSFSEYIFFMKKTGTTATFSNYLKDGGMPEIVDTGNDFAKNNLIETTIDSVIMRDIASRYAIRNVRLLRRLVDYVCCSATDELSRNKVTNILKNSTGGASIHTVSDYIEYLKEAFFIHECPVFSHKKNDLLKSIPQKIYLNDHIFSNQEHGFGGFGKLLENIVYIELKRRGCSVTTVKTRTGEVDFLSNRNGDIRYYQVTWSTGDKGSSTYQREFGNLLQIKNHYPKYVISMDDFIHPPDQGIRHIHALTFFQE